MDRKKILLEIIENDSTLEPLVDEIVYLEGELDRLRKLPKIRVHPADPTKQKATPAAKLYKEFLQQYTNCIKVLIKATGIEEVEEESPLRKWFKDYDSKRKKDMDS